MTRIVVTGTRGQVVTALAELGPRSGVDLVAIGRPDIDLGDPDSLDGPIRAARPDLIFSVAACTMVDLAEREPAMAHAVNAASPRRLALIARDLAIPIVHVSTDYVFDGEKTTPYTEKDATAPRSIYGLSKLAGEHAVIAATPDHVILRSAWNFSPFGTNFVKTMLGLAASRETVDVVADQYGNPTSALEIARVMLAVAERLVADPSAALRGIFHSAARGEASRAEFAAAIFDGLRARGGRSVTVNPITTADYPTAAHRPANSRLNSEKLLGTYGLQFDPWRVSLDRCLDQLLARPAGES